MSEIPLDEYKKRLLLYREWHKKSSSLQTLHKINTTINKDSISLDNIDYWFDRFENKDIRVLPNELKISAPPSAALPPAPSTHIPINSLLMLRENEEGGSEGNRNNRNKNEGSNYGSDVRVKETLAENGRFLISPFYCYENNKSTITITDLFCWAKRTSPVSFNIRTGTITTPLGQDLLFINDFNSRLIHILKVDYQDLGVTKLKTLDVSNFRDVKILLDQFDNQKFAICDTDKFLGGKLKNDKEIVMEDVKSFGDTEMPQIELNGQRLCGNKLQGFVYNRREQIHHYFAYWRNDRRNENFSIKFVELNLETKERMENEAKIGLENMEVDVWQGFPTHFSWCDDRFYGLISMPSNHYRLLTFNSTTLKWSDLKVLVCYPRGMFIDEFGIMTLQVGSRVNFHAHYRLSLRKPDKLTNLTLLFALKESNLYGNGKYFKIARQILI